MKTRLISWLHVLRTATARLTMSYLLIIMLMSVGFSVIFYHTSSHELGRQVPPPNYAQTPQPTTYNEDGPYDRDHRYDAFFAARIAEARRSLMQNLIIVNAATLVIGGFVSYGLARRTLEPIEANMEAQTQFVSNAAHELRTPLTSLKTANEVALRHTKFDQSQMETVLQQNIEDVTRLQQLTNGLLDLARPDGTKLKMTNVSLQVVVSDAMNQVIAPAQAKNIAVDDQVGTDIVMANQPALTQVVVILLDNAIKYSPDKSTVTVRSYMKNKLVHLEVQDNGIGITADDLPHIFQRFYRADTARTGNADHRGYGIGLAIADKIMHMHGGKIDVTSEEGKGSMFTVRLAAVL